jgi:3-oxoacyl-[acyl-carrier-protein] synthase III
MSSRRAKIIGTGHGIPSRVVTNDDLAKFVDTNDEWIRTRTGIEQRHFLDFEKGESITTIAVAGAKEALEMSGLKFEDIELVICSTATPAEWMPIEAARIKEALGLVNAAAIDVNAACSGFVYGTHFARALIESGAHKNILVIGGDVFQNVIDFKDRGTCVLFGDGAGAAVLTAAEIKNPLEEAHIIGTKVYAELDRDGSLTVTDKKVGEKQYIKMNGREVFKHASKGMVQAAVEILKENNISIEEVKWFVPHQANIRIIEKVAEFLNFPMEKVYVNVQKWGNTSAGTIPICLSEMNQQGLLKKGDLILLTSFGGGYTWGSVLIRW